ncbi:MAG: hypothetical protein ACRC9Y_14090 [Aeromonas veronii]
MMSEWISIKDRLPVNSLDEMSQDYECVEIIVSDGISSSCAEFMCGRAVNFWWIIGGDMLENEPTHWMHLPPPYKGGDPT